MNPVSLQVAGVVAFYMSAALIVSHGIRNVLTRTDTHLLSRWFLCAQTHCSLSNRLTNAICSNKAVLNDSPDLPLLFLLLQLLIAVVLLHASAAVSKRIEIPKLDREVGKKLVPVVLVNVIGLVFNTLCLRDVEASFFQARTSFRNV